MNRRFLVASDDDSVSDWEPVVVLAGSKEEAIDRYLRIEYSKNPIFRENVLDLSINCSFVEKFFLTTSAENHSFKATGQVDYDLDIVKSRVRAYFSERPDLGEKFVLYVDTRDASHVDEEVFEFISAADPGGIVALDIDEIRQV